MIRLDRAHMMPVSDVIIVIVRELHWAAKFI